MSQSGISAEKRPLARWQKIKKVQQRVRREMPLDRGLVAGSIWRASLCPLWRDSVLQEPLHRGHAHGQNKGDMGQQPPRESTDPVCACSSAP
ncbi:hypothetical protein MTO96_006649 [Rhipicephalus appendiculatus]